MKVKGPVACLLATLISVLATVTVAADTDTDSSATAAHGLRVSKAKEENRALEDLSHSQMRTEYKALKVEARAATVAVKRMRKDMDEVIFRKDTTTVWEECPRFKPTSDHSCDPITLTYKCPFYGNKCLDAHGICNRNRHCECVAGKFSCTKQEETCKPCKPLTKEKCEKELECDLEENRGEPVSANGYSIRNLTRGFKFNNTLNGEYAAKYGNEIGCWNVSQVTNMDLGFVERHFFNKPLCWDVSKVTSMYGMFYDARFDQDISFWDVSNVMDFQFMFRKNTFEPEDVRAYFNLEDDDEDEDFNLEDEDEDTEGL